MKYILILPLLAFYLMSSAYGALTPLLDSDLSEATGQAFMSLDRHTEGNIEYTKLRMGMEINTLLSADAIELGRYERAGEAFGTSDVKLNDFGLGHIDGNGNVVPFYIKDPFIELAYENNGGREDLVGIRMGFGEARGKLLGDIQSLTGNLQISLRGTAQPVYDQADFWTDIALGLAGVYAGNTLYAGAELVDWNGNPDPVRAVAAGMRNGQIMQCADCWLGGLTNALLSLFTSQNCSVSGVQTCFPLGSYKSIDIGNGGASATGMFLSFQTKPVTWYDPGRVTTTVEGAFMNIPNGGIEINFEQAFVGTPRYRNKYIDPFFD